MAEFISEHFGIDYDAFGVFDALMDSDSNYFINITRLKDAKTPEFTKSYDKVNDYFNGIAILLDSASSKNKKDKFYRNALRKFDFPEVNGINLGFSKTLYGAAFGRVLSERVIADAYDIIKSGIKEPEIFHLIGLFEDNVGPDRLSDMFARIIKDDIFAYTKRINIETGIVPENYPGEIFNNGIVYNAYKKCDLLLLPEEILHELPIARSWDDIDRVASENNAIRAEINQIIGNEWSKYSSSQKKEYLKLYVFEVPFKCQRVLNSYRGSHEEECNWSSDVDYYAEKKFRELKNIGFDLSQQGNTEVTSREAIEQITKVFKEWVEDNKGWAVILDLTQSKREKFVQRLLNLAAKEYIDLNSLDLSFESNSGRGPVDLKVSRGADKSICEIKLSSNNQYLHGYETQIEEYGKAERTENLFYIFIDVGNPERLKNIKQIHQKNVDAGIRCPELIIIDSTKKDSASVF